MLLIGLDPQSCPASLACTSSGSPGVTPAAHFKRAYVEKSCRFHPHSQTPCWQAILNHLDVFVGCPDRWPRVKLPGKGVRGDDHSWALALVTLAERQMAERSLVVQKNSQRAQES